MALEIEASHRLVLECGGCGERLLLLGREDYWYGEGRRAFSCGGCGGQLALCARIVVVADASPTPQLMHRSGT